MCEKRVSEGAEKESPSMISFVGLSGPVKETIPPGDYQTSRDTDRTTLTSNL